MIDPRRELRNRRQLVHPLDRRPARRLHSVQPPSPPEDDPQQRLPRVRQGVEQQLAEAAKRGELSGLEGEGRALSRDPDDATAPERWAAAHVLRNANAAPEWADLRRDLFAARDALARRIRAHRRWLLSRRAALGAAPAERVLEHARATEAADRRFQNELLAALSEYNGRIARHNLLVSTPLLQLTTLTMERLDDLAREEQAT